MKDKIKDLLAVLDMPEDSPEQYGWLLSIIREHKACCLADLAFRLRDEAVRDCPEKWEKAKAIVVEARTGIYKYKEVMKGLDGYENGLKLRVNTSFCDYAKSKHWIITALIAKELAKVKDDKANKT